MPARAGNSNKIRYSKILCFFLIIWCACSLNLTSAFAADVANKQELLKNARDAYYSLNSRGFKGFESDLTPNWRVTLKQQIAADPAGSEAGLKKLARLHFALSLDSNGKTKVTHWTDAAPANEKEAAAYQQIYSGMEQAMTGLFETWSAFMIYPPFPAVNSDYRLEETPNGYRLSYMENASNIVTLMAKDFSIISTTVTAPDFTSVINPVFTKTPQGYVLAGYDGIYRAVSSRNEDTNLSVEMKYKEVNGLRLPLQVDMRSTYGGSPVNEMEIVFSNHRLNTH